MEILILLLVVLVAATLTAVTSAYLRGRPGRNVDLEPPSTVDHDLPQDNVGAEPLAAPREVMEQAVDAGNAPPERLEADLEAEVGDEVDVEPEAPAERPRFRDRLGKARSLLAGYVGSVLSRTRIDDETWDDLEEALIRADVGVKASTEIMEGLRKEVADAGITEPDVLLDRLKADLKQRLQIGDRALAFDAGRPNVWLFVGVNGVGKTTTIGKVAKQQQEEGRSVMMAAGDTFRAAAAEQLETWADRTGADILKGAEGADPSSVIFDAVQRAGARGVDLVLADTAGRLHTKVNLMEELRKVRRVADREPGKVTEVLLVLDATTGQNGLVQAQQFTDAVDVTGVVLTKLDGSAKGGIVLAIQTDLGIPVKLVGLGETVDDLVPFDPDEFVEALFS